MRKICVVITARASYSRVKSLLSSLSASDAVELTIIAMASAVSNLHGNPVKYIENDGFKVSYQIPTLLEEKSLITSAKTAALGILELTTIFSSINPDIVVTIADRYETIATAIAASYLNIPLAHIQGGERTGNIDEKVRHAITKLSDYHFVATSASADRVRKLGEDPRYIFKTGCPSLDLIGEITGLDFDPYSVYSGVGTSPDLSKGYYVVLQHPVTNEQSDSISQVDETAKAVQELKLPVLWFWPNVDAGSDQISKRLRMYREKGLLQHVHFFKNMTSLDFLKLLKSSRCLIGNSSAGIRECSFLGVPSVNIGTRQSGRERGLNVLDCQHESSSILNAILTQQDVLINPSDLYGDGSAGQRICDILIKLPLIYQKTLQY